MKEIKNQSFEGERALFFSDGLLIEKCDFHDGESPLKESKNLTIKNSTFKWKYPLWYCENIECEGLLLEEMARSGIWYTHNIKMTNCLFECPKTFRRASKITLINCKLPNAKETIWMCSDIKIIDTQIDGDYLCINSENIEFDNVLLNGNYAFDGSKNIVVKNSILNSKDAFWNAENVVVTNCKIVGEYLGWNSKNLTFINCEIESHQGLCYIDGLKMINCKLINSDLTFEYCSKIDADIDSEIDSVINPTSGTIRAKGIKQLIFDEHCIDPDKTKIIIK